MTMRHRKSWVKMNGIDVHPPGFIKKMGRPPKNRNKTLEEEKKKKDGTIYINKKGVNMHCSICGNADHKKRGHDKYMSAQHEAQLQDEEVEDPTILQVTTYSKYLHL